MIEFGMFGFSSPFEFAAALIGAVQDHNDLCDEIDRWNDDGGCYAPWPYGCGVA